MIHTKNTLSLLACVAIAALVAFVLVGCSSSTPAPAPQAPASTAPPVVITVPVEKTVVVTSAPVVVTGAPVVVTATPPPTVAPSATPTRGAVVVPKATAAGGLEIKDIEFAPSAPRQGDNKVQLTVILHLTGAAPFQVLEENIPQTVKKRVDGVEYTRNWENCGFNIPVTIRVISANGQTATQKIELPYATFKCP